MSNREYRWDAADSYFVDNQLRSMDPNEHWHLVPGTIGRRILTAKPGVSPNKPAHQYTMVRIVGRAKKGGRSANDAGIVKIVKETVTTSIKTYRDTFSYELDDVRAAQENGSNLDQDGYMGALSTVEQQVDGTLCVGDGDTKGIANNPNIASTAPTNKTGGGTAWNGAGVKKDEIIADFAKATDELQGALKQAQIPGSNVPMFDSFVWLVPMCRYSLLTMAPRSESVDTTIMNMLSKFPQVAAVIPWWRLDTANGGNPMAICAPAITDGDTIKVHPMAAKAILPGTIERLPPQYSAETTSVLVRAKSGGVEVPFPVAFRYLKNI